MGQTMTSETLSISGSDGYYYSVGLQAKPIHRGHKKTVYKGILLGPGPRQWEKVVAKSFTDIPGSKEYWSDEVNKAIVAKELAIKFGESFPAPVQIKVVIPGMAQMDKFSKINRWLEHRQGHRSLGKDDWISIEEYIPGPLSRYCPWSKRHVSEDNKIMGPHHLQTFSHFTYKETNGELVVCDFQGIFEDQTYILTDSIIHSRLYNHGRFDEGDYGISEFFKHHKCSQLCKDWQKPLPLDQPLKSDSLTRECSKQVRFDLTPFENVLFPSERTNGINESNNKAVQDTYTSDQNAQEKEEKNQINLEVQKCEQSPKYAIRSRALSQGALPVENHFEQLHPRPRTMSDGGQRLTQIPKNIDTMSTFYHDRNKETNALQRRSCLKRSFRNQNTATAQHEFPLSPKITSFESEDICLQSNKQSIPLL
jgi:hypothetical protein